MGRIEQVLWLLGLMYGQFGTPSSELGPSVMLDRAVASVDQSVMTWSELLFEARLVLLRDRGEAEATSFLNTSQDVQDALRALRGPARSSMSKRNAEFLTSILDALIQKRLLVLEARRLSVQGSSSRSLRRQARAILQERSARSLFGLDDAENLLFDSLSEEKLASRFAALQLRSVSDVSEAAFARCAARQPSTNPETLRVAMKEAKQEARLQQVLRRLRNKTEIRYAEPFFRRPQLEVRLCPRLSP